MSILLSVASIVTPFGLYSALEPGSCTNAQFVYAQDPSPFGYGTPPRSNYPWARLCRDFWLWIPCPSSSMQTIITKWPNRTISYDYPYDIDLTLPEVIQTRYSSGTNKTSTVSNSFDIQWRRWGTRRHEDYNNGSEYLVSANRNIETLVMSNDRRLVEGLVVDALNGGIGFRNHTVPIGFKYGVTWEEDLLFIQPETVCVDTNLTLDFEVSALNTSFIAGAVLTDRGGFVNLNITYPEADLSNTQKNADLSGRAYKAAWFHNALTAVYFNATNPANGSTKAFHYWNTHLNKTFPIDMQSEVLGLDELVSLEISSIFGSYVRGMPNGSAATWDFNPWNVGRENYSQINILCSGAGEGDLANVSNILVACGQMRGVPQRVNPGSNLVFDDGSKWSQKIFACASAVKATVKKVSFVYNNSATDGSFDGFAVKDINEKRYTGPSDTPLWGVEHTGNKYNISQLNLVWGLLSKTYEGHPNVSTVRQPHLYLPGWVDPNDYSGAYSYGSESNMPGSAFSIGALQTAYNVKIANAGLSGALSPRAGGVDYTGGNSIAMWARWQNLTENAKTAALIPDLIWTDASASTVVGTKGVSPAEVQAQEPGLNCDTVDSTAVHVIPLSWAVRYHYPYGVPAFICAAILLGIFVWALVVAVCGCGQGQINRMRSLFKRLSLGRVYTTFLYEDRDSQEHSIGRGLDLASSEWSKKFGSKVVDLSGPFPSVIAESDEPPSSLRRRVTHNSQGQNEAMTEVSAALVGNNDMGRDIRARYSMDSLLQTQPADSGVDDRGGYQEAANDPSRQSAPMPIVGDDYRP